jgi:membrane protease YdiL (CAAX protease family)
MVMAQNLLLLLFGKAGLGGTIPSLTAFLGASMAAILIFFLYNYENGGESWSVLVKNSAPKDAMYFFFTLSALILSMYLVSAVILGDQPKQISVTPLYIVSLLVVHPLIEEYIFRGLFYGELRNINPIFGITAQAIMFAIIHSTVDGMIYALISGVILGFAMEKTRKIWVPILAHSFINGRSLLYLTLLSDKPTLRQTVDTALICVGAISILILIFTKGRESSIDTKDKEMPEVIVEYEENKDD